MTADTNEPHDIEAEQATLGGLILGGTTVDGLQSADFYRAAHQLAFEAIEGLRGEGKPVSAISLVDELRRRGTLRKVGGAPGVHTLMEAAPSAAQAPYYGGIVRQLAERRRVLRTADRLHQMALNPGADIGSIRDLAAELSRELPAPASRGRKLVLTSAAEIEPEPVIWAWEDDDGGRIPAGSFGLAAGREGTGKSSFLIWLAAKITTGTLPGSLCGRPHGVIYVAVEDSWKYTIVPRLMAAGANLKLVYRAEVQVVEDDTMTLSLPADNRLLEEAINANDIALVALDPLLSAISGDLDTHVNRDVRQALDPLARIADRTGALFAGISHFNKSAGTDASNLITASGAFKDVARFIFAFATNPEDGAKVITQTKNSLGHSDLPSMAYRIIEATVPTAKGDAKVARFTLDGRSEHSVGDFLGLQAGAGGRGEKVRASDYLRKALADGPRLSAEVEDEGIESGYSKRTLDRARQDLKIAKRKVGKVWWIALPEHEGDLNDLPAETVKDAKNANVGTVGNHAKNANAASPGDVGTVGNVDRLRLEGWPAGSEGDGGRAA